MPGTRPRATLRTSSKSGDLRGSPFDSVCKASGELCQHCFGLSKPVRHPHLAIHRRRDGEVLLRLLALVRGHVELAEGEEAVGDEGAHAPGCGEGECVDIMRLAAVGVEAVVMRGDVAEQMQRMSSCSEPPRKQFHRTLSQMLRLVELTEQQTREAQTVIDVPCE